MASSSQYLVIFELASSRNFLRIYDLNFCQFKKKERKKYMYILRKWETFKVFKVLE